MTDDTDLKNSASEHEATSDRTERGDRSSERGEERSGGRRDRSREMLREELERNLDDATRRSGRPRDWEPADRPARAAREATAEAKDREQEAGAGGAGADAAVDLAVPPARLTKEQKEKWPGLDKYWQGVIHKIDTDSQAGHEKDKRARAAEDAAWAPHDATIRSFGLDRAATVTRLMQWFEGLSRDPVRNFPALVKAMGAEQALLQHAQRQQQNGTQAQQLDPFQQYAQSVEQRLNGFQQTIAQQQEAAQMEKCNAVLAEFAKGRTHFEKVRGAMAAFLQPDANGRSLVPLTPDGQVDLSTAYDMAVRADPTLGEQLISERIAAKTKTQREQAERARRAGSSLGGAAPGGNNSLGAPKKRSGSVSVRESLRQSLDELAGR